MNGTLSDHQTLSKTIDTPQGGAFELLGVPVPLTLK